ASFRHVSVVQALLSLHWESTSQPQLLSSLTGPAQAAPKVAPRRRAWKHTPSFLRAPCPVAGLQPVVQYWMGSGLHPDPGSPTVKVYVPVAVSVAVGHWFPVELFFPMT